MGATNNCNEFFRSGWEAAFQKSVQKSIKSTPVMLFLFFGVQVIQKRTNQFFEKIVYSNYHFFIILGFYFISKFIGAKYL